MPILYLGTHARNAQPAAEVVVGCTNGTWYLLMIAENRQFSQAPFVEIENIVA